MDVRCFIKIQLKEGSRWSTLDGNVEPEDAASYVGDEEARVRYSMVLHRMDGKEPKELLKETDFFQRAKGRSFNLSFADFTWTFSFDSNSINIVNRTIKI